MTPLVVSWGGGTNSTAMLIGMRDRQMIPDRILFADTGGEKPHTYEFVKVMQDWLQANGMPAIEVVQNDGMYVTLENNCLKKRMLPSLAYGFKSCSDKYKRRPQEKALQLWPVAVEVWDAGGKIEKAIGFDADESHRSAIEEDEKYSYVYPLIEWGWGRKECLQAIAREGLPNPGKSSCFFCPASKKQEIRELKSRYPDLFDRAVAMERGANLTDIKGLGRYFSWESFAEADEKQAWLFPEVIDEPCMCYDGGE